jgi:hypothetical protein
MLLCKAKPAVNNKTKKKLNQSLVVFSTFEGFVAILSSFGFGYKKDHVNIYMLVGL